MKYWQRFLGTIVAVATAVVWVNVYEPGTEAGPDKQQRSAYFSKVMDQVSRDWSMGELESLMQPDVLRTEKAKYRRLLERASGLGRFLGCDKLNLGDFDDDALDRPPFDRLDVDRAYQGNGRCQFARGEAFLLVGYVQQEGQPELALLIVKDIHLNDEADG